MIQRLAAAPRRNLWVAATFSLALHLTLLLVDLSVPTPLFTGAAGRPAPPLDVQLRSPSRTEQAKPVEQALATPPRPAPAPQPERGSRAKPQTRLLAQSRRQSSVAVEPPAERAPPAPLNEQERKFFEEIAPAKPAASEPLQQRALATARAFAREDAQAAREQARSGAESVDPHSMEMYMDAFLRKLNRSARFVERDRSAEHGQRIAVVQVNLNANGTLKSYKVLSAADQQAEIAYVRSVVERAAPFAAFPPDIRAATSSLSFNICILPPRPGFGSGMFSRSLGGSQCEDEG